MIFRITNKLHVFGAQFKENNFKYGSGQKKSEYIFNWKDENTFPEWPIHVEKSGDYVIDIYFHTVNNAKGKFSLYKNDVLVGLFDNTGKNKVTLQNVSLTKGESILKLKLTELLGDEAGRLKYMVITKK